MMDRAQFMQELEKLLADISETERQDALDFYNSYFDDAGAENEASVLRELGSPEKVAAIIKADLKGSAGGYEYGEYTEHGYEDARTKERGQMPEKYGEESGTGKRFFRKGNQAVLILAVILLVFISPFVKGAVGGILTFAVGILLLPFWLIVGLGIGAVALLVGGLAAVRHNLRYSLFAYTKSDGISRRTRTVCNGASELSSARSKERLSAYMGKSKGLYPESVYRNLCGIYRYMVFTNV